MNDPRLNYANEYPVEILPPDISGYKKTNFSSKNKGLPYLF